MINPVTGVQRLLVKVFGSRNDRFVKELRPLVEQVNSHDSALKATCLDVFLANFSLLPMTSCVPFVLNWP